MIEKATIDLEPIQTTDYLDAWKIYLKADHCQVGFCGFHFKTWHHETLLVLNYQLSIDVSDEMIDFCGHYAHDYYGQNTFSLLIDEDVVDISKGKQRYDYTLLSLFLDEHVASHDLVLWDYDIYQINLKGKEIGRIVYRHGTDEQLQYCGHIGYEIEPAYRGHRYSRTALCLLMDQLKNKKEKLILSCDNTNIASKKIIESLHPISHKQVVVDDGEFETLDIYEVKL